MSSAKLPSLALIVLLILSSTALAQSPAPSKESAMAQHTLYQTVKVDGLNIFYHEARPKDASTILLLHDVFGVASLPLGSPVKLEVILEVKA
jgi:hypothetical protein